MAQALIASRLASHGVLSDAVAVASAGTGALVGAPVDPPVRAMLDQLGVRMDPPHRARAVTADLVSRADLILALARAHREWLVREWPAAGRKIFTLRELAAVAAAAAPETLIPAPREPNAAPTARESLTASLAAASSLRAWASRGFAPADFDVVDPYRRPPEVYRQMAAQLTPAAAAVADFLAALSRCAP
jgi:protein-tyrosine phosphatase